MQRRSFLAAILAAGAAPAYVRASSLSPIVVPSSQVVVLVGPVLPDAELTMFARTVALTRGEVAARIARGERPLRFKTHWSYEGLTSWDTHAILKDYRRV